MNAINSSSIEDIDLSIETSIIELQRQLGESIDRLSPERLHVLADFADYLVDIESEAATQELLAVPGLLERVKQSKSIPKAHCKNWREICSDI